MDMYLQVIGNNMEIAKEIDAFPSNYHTDFFRVRSVAREYLECTGTGPSEDATRTLAKHLGSVLINWGAGKRGAPQPRCEPEITGFLHDTRLHVDLGKIARTGLASLSLQTQTRNVLDGAQITDARQFDEILLSVLARLSEGLFIRNTNVTYPMKAMLLISGLMPAFDSQVRAGLSRAGFGGVNKTQFLLPSSAENDPDGKKVTRLPFVLGHCWATSSHVLSEGIRKSHYPELIEEPGRVFDILFFMQKNSSKQLLKFQHSGLGRWYEFP